MLGAVFARSRLRTTERLTGGGISCQIKSLDVASELRRNICGMTDSDLGESVLAKTRMTDRSAISHSAFWPRQLTLYGEN